MKQAIFAVRVLVLIFSGIGGYLVSFAFAEVETHPVVAVLIGLLLGALLILIDSLSEGFSLRALSALTFGLFAGLLASTFISMSPLFQGGDPQVIYISRLAVYIAVTYLATVIALRGRDEFNLVIPYVKFEPRNVASSLIVLDTSALVDGRIAKLCQAGLINDTLSIPKFVLDELQEQAGSSERDEMNRGKRGLSTIEALQSLGHIELRIHDSELSKSQSPEDKIIYVVGDLKGRLFSASENLIRKAKYAGIPYVDLLSLDDLLTRNVEVGATLPVKLVKLGKEDGQAVGYLDDGSMMVVSAGAGYLNSTVLAEVDSIIPTSGGRLVFAKFVGEAG